MNGDRAKVKAVLVRFFSELEQLATEAREPECGQLAVALDDVWSILTALRGPDGEDCLTKKHLTEPIRGRVLPELCRLVGASVSSAPLPTTEDIVHLTGERNWHFRIHAECAVKALASFEME